jgi:hypothetical protein
VAKPYLVVFVIRKNCWHLLANKDTSLKGPSTRNVSHGITAATNYKCRLAETLNEPDAVCVALHTQVEAAQSITRKTVSAALENNSFRLVIVHDSLDDWLKDRLVGDIVNTIAEWEVDGVILASAYTDIAKLTSTWEILSVLVERAGHDSVGGIEGFFNTITMMNVDVNVEDALLESQELNYAEDNI